MNAKSCGNCGLFNEAGAFACVRCGFRFDGAPMAPRGTWAPPGAGYAPRATGNSKSTIVVIVLVVGLVVVGFGGIVAAIAIPSLIRARAAANQAAAIGMLRSIASAEATYQGRHGRYATLDELAKAGLIGAEIRNGMERNSYIFREVKVTAESFEFCAEAMPNVTSGDDSYNITEDFVIREREGTTPPKGKSGTPIS